MEHRFSAANINSSHIIFLIKNPWWQTPFQNQFLATPLFGTQVCVWYRHYDEILKLKHISHTKKNLPLYVYLQVAGTSPDARETRYGLRHTARILQHMNDGRHLALVARTATVCLAAAAGTCGKGTRTHIYHTISGPTGGRLARARALDSGHQPCELPPPPDDNDPAVTVGTRILSAAHAHATAISSAFSISYVPTGAASGWQCEYANTHSAKEIMPVVGDLAGNVNET